MIGRPPKALRDFPDWYSDRAPVATNYGDFRPLSVHEQRMLIGDWVSRYEIPPFYVYFLFDSQLDEPFYVGVTNTLNRPSQHLLDAWNGKQSDKCDRIRAVEAAGYSVKFDVAEMMFLGGPARDTERWLIKKFGKAVGGPLLNDGPGGEGPWGFDDLYIQQAGSFPWIAAKGADLWICALDGKNRNGKRCLAQRGYDWHSPNA